MIIAGHRSGDSRLADTSPGIPAGMPEGYIDPTNWLQVLQWLRDGLGDVNATSYHGGVAVLIAPADGAADVNTYHLDDATAAADGEILAGMIADAAIGVGHYLNMWGANDLTQTYNKLAANHTYPPTNP